MNSILYQVSIYFMIVIIFSTILLCIWLGYNIRKIRVKKNPESAEESMGSIQGSILGILSLLMGFTFSVPVSKFEIRRELLVKDINDISTAILRCDMFPDSIRTSLRSNFKDFLEARIEYYDAMSDEKEIAVVIAKANKISGRIWNIVMEESKNPDFRIQSQQMIPVLNQVIDNIIARDTSRIMGVPQPILWALIILVIITSLIIGAEYHNKVKNFILMTAYALVMTITLNLIFELNTPRKGLINLNAIEKRMIDLRKHFN